LFPEILGAFSRGPEQDVFEIPCSLRTKIKHLGQPPRRTRRRPVDQRRSDIEEDRHDFSAARAAFISNSFRAISRPRYSACEISDSATSRASFRSISSALLPRYSWIFIPSKECSTTSSHVARSKVVVNAPLGSKRGPSLPVFGSS